MSRIVFAVEEAGCESCAALVRDVLGEVAVVDEVTIDEAADHATVRMSGGAVTQDDVRRLLESASTGTGHSYRIVPGSWREA